MVNNFPFAFVIPKGFPIPIPKNALKKNIKLYSSSNGYLRYVGEINADGNYGFERFF